MKNTKASAITTSKKKSASDAAASWLRLSALLAGTSVALGAFGAHGLKNILTETSLQTFEVAVRYQMYHSLAMIALSLSMMRIGQIQQNNQKSLSVSKLRYTLIFFLMGILLFSGSLYAMTFTSIKYFAWITPIGGVCFLIGWGLLAWTAQRFSKI